MTYFQSEYDAHCHYLRATTFVAHVYITCICDIIYFQ